MHVTRMCWPWVQKVICSYAKSTGSVFCLSEIAAQCLCAGMPTSMHGSGPSYVQTTRASLSNHLLMSCRQEHIVQGRHTERHAKLLQHRTLYQGARYLKEVVELGGGIVNCDFSAEQLWRMLKGLINVCCSSEAHRNSCPAW